MKIKHYLLVLSLLLIGTNANARELTVHVEKAGTLSELIPEDQLSVEELKITGEINGDDIEFMDALQYDFYHITFISEKLDLSEATIVSGGTYYINKGSQWEIKMETQKDEIGPYMFSNWHCKTIVLPKVIKGIGACAFFCCYWLTGLELPENVTALSDSIFMGCEQLETIKIPQAVTKIGTGAFSGCKSISEITLPEGITVLPDEVFYRCSQLKTVNIPKNVTNIGIGAFSYCI